jgi:outer membrane protein TolC
MRTFQFKGARAGVWRTAPGLVILCLLCILALSIACPAQISFASAIQLAVRNSPRVRTAELDLTKAQRNLAIAKDIFIPSVVTGGGLGWTHGITLTVPTIFTVNAQSLVYSNQQRYAIRAAHADVQAAQFALAEARQQTEEDAAITCFSIEENRSALAALSQQQQEALRLVAILEDRVRGGLDSELDLHKAQRGELQIELQKLQAEDGRASLLAHLAELTGMPENELKLESDSIPSVPDAHVADVSTGAAAFSSPGLLAAQATARGKLERAKGEQGYTWRPIINFAAQYGRVSPINDVSSFYNLHGNYNTANIGVVFSFPMFDRVRKDAARISAADAARAQIDATNQRAEEFANSIKMERSVKMIETREQITELDYSIAEDELKSTVIQLHDPAGSPPLTPKEEQNARIQERQKFLDLLDARLQLSKAKITLLRQTGQLDTWVHALVGPLGAAPGGINQP